MDDETDDDAGAQIRRMTMSEFRQSAIDVLERAKQGEQTIVEDADGKPLMVIGSSRHPTIIVESAQFEEVADFPDPKINANRWFR